MTRCGSLFELPILERRTSGKGSLWSRGEYPTPTASRYGSSNNGDPGDARSEYATKGTPSLDTWAKGWPTPLASDAQRGADYVPPPSKKTGPNLVEAVAMWPKATASDAKGSRRHGYMLTGHSGTTLLDAVIEHGRQDQETPQAGKSGSSEVVLNPAFVEALMGFPPRWIG